MPKTQSTTARVSDIGAVQDVLDGYRFDFTVELKADDGAVAGTIRMFHEDDWPSALKRNWLPDPEETSNRECDEIERHLFMEEGDEGFTGLLLDLAPFLETPLLVLGAGVVGERYLAESWSVGPGGKEVATVRIDD